VQVVVNVMLDPATGDESLAASTHDTPPGGCQLMFTAVGALVLVPLLAETE
jgi:hypothetical protein